MKINEILKESKEDRLRLSNQGFEFPQQGQYGYRQSHIGHGVLEIADGRTGKIVNIGEFGNFDDHEPNQKWLRIVFNNPNMDDDEWDNLEDMLWSDEQVDEDVEAFGHLTNKKLRRILLSGPKNIDELAWAMEYTQDALSDDYHDEMIDSRTFDARNSAYEQAEAAFTDEDGEFNPDADVDATLAHLRKFWSV